MYAFLRHIRPAVMIQDDVEMGEASRSHQALVRQQPNNVNLDNNPTSYEATPSNVALESQIGIDSSQDAGSRINLVSPTVLHASQVMPDTSFGSCLPPNFRVIKQSPIHGSRRLLNDRYRPLQSKRSHDAVPHPTESSRRPEMSEKVRLIPVDDHQRDEMLVAIRNQLAENTAVMKDARKEMENARKRAEEAETMAHDANEQASKVEGLLTEARQKAYEMEMRLERTKQEAAESITKAQAAAEEKVREIHKKAEILVAQMQKAVEVQSRGLLEPVGQLSEMTVLNALQPSNPVGQHSNPVDQSPQTTALSAPQQPSNLVGQLPQTTALTASQQPPNPVGQLTQTTALSAQQQPLNLVGQLPQTVALKAPQPPNPVGQSPQTTILGAQQPSNWIDQSPQTTALSAPQQPPNLLPQATVLSAPQRPSNLVGQSPQIAALSAPNQDTSMGETSMGAEAATSMQLFRRETWAGRRREILADRREREDSMVVDDWNQALNDLLPMTPNFNAHDGTPTNQTSKGKGPENQRQSRGGIPVVPQVSTVPRPMQFSKNQRKVPIPPPPRVGTSGINSLGANHAGEQTMGLGIDDKLDLILSKMAGNNNGRTGRKTRRREFKHPVQKGPREEGRNKRLEWARRHINELMGINKTNDVLKFSDELFSTDTPLQREMVAYEEDGRGPGPNLTPMRVNWKNINGVWNEELFQQFLEFSERGGYADGTMGEDDEEELREIFFNRLKRILSTINQHRPRSNETVQDAQQRAVRRHKETLAISRRNTRRKELLNMRLDTIEERLPDPTIPIDSLTDEAKSWIDCYRIVDTLGLEGQSSDESSDDDNVDFNVKTLEWRNKKLVKKLKATDDARKTTNRYGNRRSGAQPRTRKRRARDSRVSTRAAPAGKPINFYDESWYAKLPEGKRKELEVKQPVEFLTSLDN